MPRSKNKLPSHCIHKASRQTVVRLDGREHYLGKYGSPESRSAYRRLTAEWRAGITRRFEPRRANVL